MKETIDKLVKQEKELTKKVLEVRDAIEALRNVCEHPEWEYIGHDSHNNHEQCTTCGKIDYRC